MIDTNGSSLVVLDVREESEYCEDDPDPLTDPPPGHISDALNYPWNTGVLEANYGELPDDKPILVLCRVGGRSAAAADFLCNQEQFMSTPIYNMLGGMLAWEWGTVLCCYSDTDCDDGLYCTGDEFCVDLNCQPSTGDPCAQQPYFCCDEDADICVEQYPHIDYDCDGVPDDGGDHTCTPGEIEGCDENCFDKPNGPNLGTCVKPKGGVIASYRVGGDFITCTSDADCTGTGGTCQDFQGDSNGNGVGDVCECYTDGNKDGKVAAAEYALLKNEYGRYDCPLSPGVGTGDTDGDGVIDEEDNCPAHPNGSTLGTCVATKGGMISSYRVGGAFITCTGDGDCTGTGGTCQDFQGDSNGNGVGDVCECYTDGNKDGKVTAAEYALLRNEFGRYDCPTYP